MRLSFGEGIGGGRREPTRREKSRRGTQECVRYVKLQLLDGDAFGEVPRLIDVAAAADGDVVGE